MNSCLFITVERRQGERGSNGARGKGGAGRLAGFGGIVENLDYYDGGGFRGV